MLPVLAQGPGFKIQGHSHTRVNQQNAVTPVETEHIVRKYWFLMFEHVHQYKAKVKEHNIFLIEKKTLTLRCK